MVYTTVLPDNQALPYTIPDIPYMQEARDGSG